MTGHPPASQGLTIQSSAILARARAGAWPVEEEGGRPLLRAPGGYKFYILDLKQPKDRWGWRLLGKDLVDFNLKSTSFSVLPAN